MVLDLVAGFRVHKLHSVHTFSEIRDSGLGIRIFGLRHQRIEGLIESSATRKPQAVPLPGSEGR